MIDLEQILVCEGRPTIALIDYKVDFTVKKMLDDFLFESLIPDEEIVKIENTINFYDNFNIYAEKKYIFDVINDIDTSLTRYQPFVKYDPDFTIPCEYTIDDVLEPDELLGIAVHIVVNITPQMKKAMLLNRKLSEKNSPIATVKSKI